MMSAIVGSAVLPNRKYLQPEEDLISRALVGAVRDAGIRREDVQGVIGITPRSQVLQQYQAAHVATRLRIPLNYVAEVDPAAMGFQNALILARHAVTEGELRAVAIFGASRESVTPTADFFENRTSRTSDASFVGAFGMTPVAWNALAATEMIADGEATLRDFADVAVRLRTSACQNSVAYFQEPITQDEVLGSRMVAEPLTLLMVCPRNDGAGAIIMAGEELTRQSRDRAIRHVAQGVAHDGDNIVSEFAGRSFYKLPASRRAAHQAFNRAGIDYGDVDVAEPLAPFAPMEIMIMRGLGFSRDYSKVTSVSPSGGLVSRGHPILATNFYNVHEIVQQLRNEASSRQVEGARYGITVGESGNYNLCVVDVFTRLSNSSRAARN